MYQVRHLGGRRGFLALLVLVTFPAVAAAFQPHVVFFVSSIDKLQDDVRFLLRKSTDSQSASVLDGMIEQMGLDGGDAVDRSKPLGFYLSLNHAKEPEVVIFIPVGRSKTILDLLRPFFPDQSRTADGSMHLKGAGPQLFCKFSQRYCFLSPTEPAVARALVPKSFSRSKYGIGFEVNFAGFSDEHREFVLERLLANVPSSPKLAFPGQAPSYLNGQEFGRRIVLDATKQFLREAERFTTGVTLNRRANEIEMDVEVVAKPGTTLAGTYAKLGKTASSFSGLSRINAPFSFIVAAPVPHDLQRQWAHLIESNSGGVPGTPEARLLQQANSTRPAPSRPIERFTKAFAPKDEMDLAMVLGFTPSGDIRALVAVKVADGNQVAKLVEDMTRFARPGRPGGAASRGADNYRGMSIHTFPVPPIAHGFLGREPVLIGVGKDQVFLALGSGTAQTLKSGIDSALSPASRTPPIAIRIRPGALLNRFASKEDPSVQAALEAFRGKGDSAVLEVLPISRGTRARVTLGEGFLRLIAQKAAESLGGPRN